MKTKIRSSLRRPLIGVVLLAGSMLTVQNATLSLASTPNVSGGESKVMAATISEQRPPSQTSLPTQGRRTEIALKGNDGEDSSALPRENQGESTALTMPSSGIHSASATGMPVFLFKGTWSTAEKRKERIRIATCLRSIPASLRSPLETITIVSGRGDPRAVSDGRRIVIHSAPMADDELCNVVTHEMGHVVDIGLMTGTGVMQSPFRDGSVPIMTDDRSVAYYQLSWADEKRHKEGVDPLDFVSQYAMSDSFEDFAESLILYVRSGAYFRSLLGTSEVLEKKYAFLRDVVFQGREFDTGRAADNPSVRHYDATLIGIQYN